MAQRQRITPPLELPKVKETQSMEELKRGITRLVENYSFETYQHAKGPQVDIALPDGSGVWRAKSTRSFRDEQWYQKLSPEQQKNAEIEILQHIHSEVGKNMGTIHRKFVEQHPNTGRIQMVEEFKKYFGHIPGDSLLMRPNCVTASQMASRIAHAIGFESGIFNLLGHVAAIAKTKSGMMVIDPALFGLGALRAGVNPEYCRPMRMKEWEKAIMADTRPMVVELKEKFPHSQGVFSILEIAPFYMGETVADAKAYARFGKMLEDEGLPQEAESAYKHSMELNPNFAGANYMLGQLYSKTGRHQEAEQQLRTAIQKMPKFPSAHVQLGQLLETQGCIQEAEAEYQITLKIKPDDEEAQQRLKQLQAKKSK